MFVDPLSLGILALVVVIVAVVLVRGALARRRAYQEWRASLSPEMSSVPEPELVAQWKAGQRTAAERYQAEARASSPVATPATPEQRQVAAQAEQIRRWNAAYELANGTPPPPGAAPVLAPPKTNTLAILALVFGIGGGVLGIIFGHVALSQIAKSGENGRGLAIAGLVLGYLGVLASLIAFALLQQRGWL